MENKISKCFMSFRKSHGTQHSSLIVMLEKWGKNVDKEENVSAMFMDLPKAFGTINHDLLLAELKVYGFSKQALRTEDKESKSTINLAAWKKW